MFLDGGVQQQYRSIPTTTAAHLFLNASPPLLLLGGLSRLRGVWFTGFQARHPFGGVQGEGVHAVRVPPKAHAGGDPAAVLPLFRRAFQEAFLQLPQNGGGTSFAPPEGVQKEGVHVSI